MNNIKKRGNINYLKGFEATISNSKSLLKIASSSFQQKEYGIACSLNILSAEEAMKSFFLLMKHYLPQTEFPEFSDVFKKHKTKHHSLIWFSLFYTYLIHHILMLYKKDKKALNEIMLAPSSKLDKDVTKTIKWALKEKEHGLDFDKIKDWLNNANNQKNNGFYVDIIEENWKIPQKTSHTKFKKEQKYTQSIQTFIEMMANDLKSPEFLSALEGKLATFTKKNIIDSISK